MKKIIDRGRNRPLTSADTGITLIIDNSTGLVETVVRDSNSSFRHPGAGARLRALKNLKNPKDYP